jgi:hypothetical protein
MASSSAIGFATTVFSFAYQLLNFSKHLRGDRMDRPIGDRFEPLYPVFGDVESMVGVVVDQFLGGYMDGGHGDQAAVFRFS